MMMTMCKMFIIIGTNNNIFISGVIKNHTAFFKREYIKKRGNFFIYKKFPFIIYYFAIFSQNLINIEETCARVALPFGTNVVSVTPVIIPT